MSASLMLAQEKPKLELNELIDEALENNLELKAQSYQIEVAEAKVPQAKSLDNPELTFRLMEMQGLKPNEAMWANVELMQMFPFPGKLSSMGQAADIAARRSRQEYNEKSVEVIMRVKSAFYELWYIQKALVFNDENKKLLQQFIDIARLQYSVGKVTIQDLLKAQVELTKFENDRLTLEQKETGMLAMLAQLLNRNISEFVGQTSAPDTIQFNVDISQVQEAALKRCSRLRSDSLMVEQDREMLHLAKLEYLPDFKLGVEYVTSPMTGFRGWSLAAGVSLPFSFWTLGKANARLDEATASIKKSTAMYNDERNMLLSRVKDFYTKAVSLKRQYDLYRESILPQSEQALSATLTNYQTGRTDFLMLIDSYRMLVMFKMEFLMKRMEFEQTLADLEKEIGCRDIEDIL
jgi:outer membrane protein TolC